MTCLKSKRNFATNLIFITVMLASSQAEQQVSEITAQIDENMYAEHDSCTDTLEHIAAALEGISEDFE